MFFFFHGSKEEQQKVEFLAFCPYPSRRIDNENCACLDLCESCILRTMKYFTLYIVNTGRDDYIAGMLTRFFTKTFPFL